MRCVHKFLHLPYEGSGNPYFFSCLLSAVHACHWGVEILTPYIILGKKYESHYLSIIIVQCQIAFLAGHFDCAARHCDNYVSGDAGVRLSAFTLRRFQMQSSIQTECLFGSTIEIKHRNDIKRLFKFKYLHRHTAALHHSTLNIDDESALRWVCEFIPPLLIQMLTIPLTDTNPRKMHVYNFCLIRPTPIILFVTSPSRSGPQCRSDRFKSLDEMRYNGRRLAQKHSCCI